MTVESFQRAHIKLTAPSVADLMQWQKVQPDENATNGTPKLPSTGPASASAN